VGAVLKENHKTEGEKYEESEPKQAANDCHDGREINAHRRLGQRRFAMAIAFCAIDEIRNLAPGWEQESTPIGDLFATFVDRRYREI
jgi:hypothetical protein